MHDFPPQVKATPWLSSFFDDDDNDEDDDFFPPTETDEEEMKEERVAGLKAIKMSSSRSFSKTSLVFVLDPPVGDETSFLLAPILPSPPPEDDLDAFLPLSSSSSSASESDCDNLRFLVLAEVVLAVGVLADVVLIGDVLGGVLFEGLLVGVGTSSESRAAAADSLKFSS